MTLQLIDIDTDKHLVNQAKLALLGIMQSCTFNDLADMQHCITNGHLEKKLFEAFNGSEEDKVGIKVMLVSFADTIHAKAIELGSNIDENLSIYKNRYLCSEETNKNLRFTLNEVAKDICNKITITGSEFPSKPLKKFVEIKTCGKRYVGTFINNELSIADFKECYGYYIPIPPFCDINLIGEEKKTDFMMVQLGCLAMHEAAKVNESILQLTG